MDGPGIACFELRNVHEIGGGYKAGRVTADIMDGSPPLENIRIPDELTGATKFEVCRRWLLAMKMRFDRGSYPDESSDVSV